MAWQSTTLAAPMTKDDVTIAVASGTGFPPIGVSGTKNFHIRIDSEWMLADGQPNDKVVKVKRRGDQGTATAPHDINASVVFSGSPFDIVGMAPASLTYPPIWDPTLRTIGGDLVITSDMVAALGENASFLLHKLTPAAITLARPSFAQDGLVVSFSSAAPVAHVITSTGGFATGTAAPGSTATFGAFTGAGLSLVAAGGLWNARGAAGVVIT